MNKIKAIFVDFDWTIYDHNLHSLNKSGVEALKEAKSIGIKVIINSARTYFSLKGMENIFDKISFDGYSCSNGLIDLTDEKIIESLIIEENLIKEVIKIAEDNKINYLLTNSKHSYLKVFDEQRMKDFYSIFNEPRGLDISELKSLNNIYAIQLFILEDQDYLFDSLKEKLYFYRFFDNAIEVQKMPRNKGDSVLNFMNYFKLKPEECIAIGDSNDDIKMFEKVKYGVCMGNGNDSAKSSAFYVTDTIENDGLKKALQHFKIIN